MCEFERGLGKKKVSSSFCQQVDRFSFLLVEHTARRDGENSETDTWLDFAKDCGYIPVEDHGRLTADCKEVGAMLGAMLNNPTPFLIKDR